MSDYPEHDKMIKLRPEISAVTEFLEWLFSAGYEISEPDETPTSNIEKLLSLHFEVDLSKVDAEKAAMLTEIRKANGLDEEGNDATHKG